MWIQLALGRSRITFKQPSFKLESVKKKKKKTVIMAPKCLPYSMPPVRNVNLKRLSLAYKGGNQNTAPWATTSLCTLPYPRHLPL